MSIVYVLLQGPNGFNEVSRGAGEVNASTLAQRLVHLEEAGLVRKTVQSTMPPRTSYELTAAGRALLPYGLYGPYGVTFQADLAVAAKALRERSGAPGSR